MKKYTLLLSIFLSRLHITLTLISILIIAFVMTFDQNLFEIAISNGVQFADINLVIRNSAVVIFFIFSIYRVLFRTLNSYLCISANE